MVQCFMKFGHIVTGCCVRFIYCMYVAMYVYDKLLTLPILGYVFLRNEISIIDELMYYTYKDHKVNAF